TDLAGGRLGYDSVPRLTPPPASRSPPAPPAAGSAERSWGREQLLTEHPEQGQWDKQPDQGRSGPPPCLRPLRSTGPRPAAAAAGPRAEQLLPAPHPQQSDAQPFEDRKILDPLQGVPRRSVRETKPDGALEEQELSDLRDRPLGPPLGHALGLALGLALF